MLSEADEESGYRINDDDVGVRPASASASASAAAAQYATNSTNSSLTWRPGLHADGALSLRAQLAASRGAPPVANAAASVDEAQPASVEEAVGESGDAEAAYGEEEPDGDGDGDGDGDAAPRPRATAATSYRGGGAAARAPMAMWLPPGADGAAFTSAVAAAKRKFEEMSSAAAPREPRRVGRPKGMQSGAGTSKRTLRWRAKKTADAFKQLGVEPPGGPASSAAASARPALSPFFLDLGYELAPRDLAALPTSLPAWVLALAGSGRMSMRVLTPWLARVPAAADEEAPVDGGGVSGALEGNDNDDYGAAAAAAAAAPPPHDPHHHHLALSVDLASLDPCGAEAALIPHVLPPLEEAGWPPVLLHAGRPTARGGGGAGLGAGAGGSSHAGGGGGVRAVSAAACAVLPVELAPLLRHAPFRLCLRPGPSPCPVLAGAVSASPAASSSARRPPERSAAAAATSLLPAMQFLDPVVTLPAPLRPPSSSSSSSSSAAAAAAAASSGPLHMPATPAHVAFLPLPCVPYQS